jgi:hypothetical protein
VLEPPTAHGGADDNMETIPMINLSARAILVMAALAFTTASALARSTELQAPQRTDIVTVDTTKTLTPTLVRRAIIVGGSRRGWKPVADQPGVLTMTVFSGAHQVTVDVAYDAKGFQVKLKNSANMNEAKSGETITIHPKVNKWLADLNLDILSAAISESNGSN